MNGMGRRKPSYGAGGDTTTYLQASTYGEDPSYGAPPVKAMSDAYKGSGAQQDHLRYNTHNSSRPGSSAMLNVDDPVAMHLLVETALGDSQEFEVLSFEQVDELKKEYILLSNRVDALKRKLALESKVRDAAESLSRLYAKKGRSESSDLSAQKHRRSLLGSRGGSDVFNQSDDELAASRRKCEELAKELWQSEKRATEIQRRLLHHTAGVLQMTHRATITKTHVQTGGAQGMPPGSPESIYTYSNSRSSMTPRDDVDVFDERSLYRPAERYDENGQRIKSRSSGRPGSLGFDHSETITATEKKMEDLNQRLRALVMQINPQQTKAYQSPPQVEPNGASADPSASLQAQLAYLEQGLNDVDKQHNDALRSAQQTEHSTEERLEDLNARLEDFIHKMGFSQREPLGPPPQVTGHSLREQLEYLEQGLELVQHQNSAGNVESQQQIDQFKAVLTGLWEIMLSGEEEARQRDNSGPGAGDEHSGGIDRQFSLPSFSTKVQWLCGRVDGLMDEKDVLRRQIQQQRELNNKSDSERGSEREQLSAELERYKQDLEHSNRDASNAKQEMAAVMQRLDTARKESTMRQQQRSSEDSAAVRELERSQEEMSRLESELEELKDDHGIARAELQSKIHDSEEKLRQLQQELQTADSQRQQMVANEEQLRSQIEEKTEQANNVQGEMERLESDVVRLQTEVTVARAELDGAYGTRAQRAAEVAANPALQKEVDDLAERNKSLAEELNALKAEKEAISGGSGDLQRQIQTLKAELAETIEEYESMTKQSIEFEKEREQLENIVDGLRERCESLESQLSEEKVRWLGMKSPGVGGRDGGPAETTSTSTLKNEFKKMMRDTRAENLRILRAEQEERRKLEALVRQLKKEPTQRKSGLSQSVVA
ncbi:MAG: hypothetical protein M4579_000993 [Chaenotheca gracillima]|nr:MAG: hypothetical protein M4579_000993 [Chaenotheca gracillima]